MSAFVFAELIVYGSRPLKAKKPQKHCGTKERESLCYTTRNAGTCGITTVEWLNHRTIIRPLYNGKAESFLDHH